jgi:hypothetical protein
LSNAEAGFEVIVRDDTLAQEAQSNSVPVEERLAKQIRALEAWYAAEFERRLNELSEILKVQLQVQTEELQQHYERREKAIQEKAVQEKAVQEKAVQEKAHVSTTAHNPTKLLEEIKHTEAVAQKCASELERMVADDTVNLGLLLQMRNQQNEVRAYLRGLKFGSESEQASPASHLNHETT